MKNKFLFLWLLLVATGCSTTQYTWNDYDDDLHAYYEHPENRAKILLSLSKTIEKGLKTKTIPPGIFAEYGYLLADAGEADKAIEYFELEQSYWPESKILMAKMIRNLSKSKAASTFGKKPQL